MEDFTHFGFEKVTPKQKTSKVKELFSHVASKYDLMNDLMSGGIHRYWKNQLLKQFPPLQHAKVLDVAGGTGDIALRILKTFPHLQWEVSVCDLTLSMMQVGRDRAINEGIFQGLDWICGNAENLPIADNSMDIYTIVFGLRNVTTPEKALQEAWRVLKPGGLFYCLEFSQVSLPILARLYDIYSFKILPLLGEMVANDRPSYQYLVESIRRFPPQETLGSMLKEVGFQEVGWQNWLGGISCLHQAKK